MKNHKKTVFEEWAYDDIRVTHACRGKRALALRVSSGGMSIGVDLTPKQADAFLMLLLDHADYDLHRRPKTWHVTVSGRRGPQSQMQGLEVGVAPGDDGAVFLTVAQQNCGPLDVFVDRCLSAPVLDSLIRWLAPRLGWGLQEAA